MQLDVARSVSSCRNQELANKLREQAHASLWADSPQHHAFTAIAGAFETFRYPIFVADLREDIFKLGLSMMDEPSQSLPCNQNWSPAEVASKE